MMQRVWSVTDRANGADLLNGEDIHASNEAEALDAMAMIQGYPDFAAFCAKRGRSQTDFVARILGSISITEVQPGT